MLHWLGVEVAYVHLGKPRAANATALQSTIHFTAISEISYDLRGVNASLVGMLPVGDAFVAYGTVGAFRFRLGYSDTTTDSVLFHQHHPMPVKVRARLGRHA